MICTDGNSIDKRVETFNLTSSDFSSEITDILIRNARGIYNRANKTVVLNIDIYSNNNLIPVINNPIFTIPLAKYRPANAIEAYAVLLDSYGESKWEAFIINTNGVGSLGNWIYGNHPVKAIALSVIYYV